jgi:hypothetical protein
MKRFTLLAVLFAAVLTHAETGTIIGHGQHAIGQQVYGGLLRGTISNVSAPTTIVQVGNVVFEVDSDRHLINLPLGTVVETEYRSGLLVVKFNGKTSKRYVYSQQMVK